MSIPENICQLSDDKGALSGPTLSEVTGKSADVGERAWSAASGRRVALDPDSVQHDLARLVLALIEVLRQLMERQALRRVESGGLTAGQIERLGLTLMRLEERMEALKAHFGLCDDDLRLDLSGLIDEI